MGLYPLDRREAYLFAKGIVGSIIRKVDEDAFRTSCYRVREGGFPLRYRRASFLPRQKKDVPTTTRWNDPAAPFDYASIWYHNGNLDDSMGYADVFGYQGRGAVINNIIVDGIDPFGLENDNLSDIIRRITCKQEEQFRDKLERHRKRLAGIRIRYGAHDRRYKEALLERPVMGQTVADIARHEMEHTFLHLRFEERPFELIGLDFESRTIRLGVELGAGRPGFDARYAGILELGQNSRWNDAPCLMYSTYVKKDGFRQLHPYLVRGEVLRKDTGNDLARFMTHAMLLTNRSREFFADFSTSVRRFYKNLFPLSAMPA